MRRRLIIVASATDECATRWRDICMNLGFECFLLTVEKYHREWRFEGSKSGCSICLSDGRILDLANASNCFYTRIPFHTPDNFTSLKAINDFLSLLSYPKGGYFFKGEIEGSFNTKPLQSILRGDFSYPFTSISNIVAQTIQNGSRQITKSMSFTRSQVVDLTHPWLNQEQGTVTSTPVQTQDKIVGFEEKIHFYKCRNGSWMIFTVRIDTDSCDYRYSSPKFSQPNSVNTPDYRDFADYIYDTIGCKFFDIDLLVSDNERFFLEINLAPVPSYFEEKSGVKSDFTEKLILDWLS